MQKPVKSYLNDKKITNYNILFSKEINNSKKDFNFTQKSLKSNLLNYCKKNARWYWTNNYFKYNNIFLGVEQILTITCSKNNIIANLYNCSTRTTIKQLTAGLIGFKNTFTRSSPFACRKVCKTIINFIRKSNKNIKLLLILKGIGWNRRIVRPIFKGTSLRFSKILEIFAIPFNGCWPKKLWRI